MYKQTTIASRLSTTRQASRHAARDARRGDWAFRKRPGPRHSRAPERGWWKPNASLPPTPSRHKDGPYKLVPLGRRLRRFTAMAAQRPSSPGGDFELFPGACERDDAFEAGTVFFCDERLNTRRR
jgi:hypothetical protein